jgi:hypothetical protein
MDLPGSVPCLAALINDDANWGPLCHWPIKNRGKQKSRTCTRRIHANEVEERDDIIKELQRLIPATTEKTTSLRSAIPDIVSDIHAKLKTVSKWLVCKAVHRRENATAIFQKWSNELDDLEKARDRPVTNYIRKELEIDDDKRHLCQGRTPKGTKCLNMISNKNRDCADAIIEAIAKARNSSPTTRDNVLELAQLLLCRRYHQDQAIRKSEEWFGKIEELFPQADAAKEQPSTPPFSRVSTVDSVATQSTVLSVSTSEGSTAYSTPATSPPRKRLYDDNTTSPVSSLYSRGRRTTETTVDKQSPRITQTRVTRNRTIEFPEPVLPQFKSLSPKTNKTVFNDLYNLITRAFLPKDRAPGYLYGFKRDNGTCIKVGYTKDMSKRMKQWRNQCRQELSILFTEPVPHAHKIEGLVHATLYHERRREVLVNGKCNGGRGCETKHKEWLEVTEEHLRDVVDAWIRWFGTNPYEKGKLGSKWKDYIDNLRKTQSKDLAEPWRQWIDIGISADGKTVRAKIEMVEDKGTVIRNAKVKTEIKMDPDDEVPDFAELGRRYRQHIKKELDDEIPDFAELGRRYRQRIKEVKDENPVVLQDLPRYLHDPFV